METVIDSDFYQVLVLGEKLRKYSQGRFNLGIAKVLEDLGYGQDIQKQEKNHKLSNSDKQDFNLSPFVILEKNKLLLKKGNKLDLGSLGKGWLIDKIRKFLETQGLNFFSINAGGDIFSSFEQKIFLENPLNLEQVIGFVRLDNFSLAASSNNKRIWENDGKTYHHILHLDIPFGSKANFLDTKKVVGTFIISKQAILADGLATFTFVSNIQLIFEVKNYFDFEFLILFEDQTYLKSPGFRLES